MTIKKCFKCLCRKPLEDFYKHSAMGDGRLGKCKGCTKEDVKNHRQENLEKVRSYDRMRGSMPHRVAACKEYSLTPKGKQAHARALKVTKTRFPERHAARIKFGNAVRDGRVVPWPVCAIAECSKKPQGHHADYSQPLDVVWLCPSHHKQAHALATPQPSPPMWAF